MVQRPRGPILPFPQETSRKPVGQLGLLFSASHSRLPYGLGGLLNHSDKWEGSSVSILSPISEWPHVSEEEQFVSQ